MGRPRQVFKKRILVASIASISAMNGVAFAQEGAPIEEVVVTGIRASLENAMDIKRESTGVVDAISADDIGKFPATNLAESLQRIPGVSINRVNGEGSQITVRGFGPGFNQVTLNGRTMPTADVPVIGGGTDGRGTNGASRAFDFSNLAADGVKTLEVTKTGRSTVASGGIGATVNVVTRKPLDGDAGFTGSVGLNGIADTTVDQGDSVTPELSGSLGWANDEQTFGVAFFGSYAERHSAAASATNAEINVIPYYKDFRSQLITNPGGQGVVTGEPAGSIDDPTTVEDEDVFVTLPRDSRYHFSEFESERLNGQLVFEFAPSDNIRLAADYTFATNEGQERRADVSNWFNRPFNEVRFDNSPLPSAYFLQEATGNQGAAMQQTLRSTKDELNSFGFNAEFTVSDSFTLLFDAHTSEAEVSPNGPGGYSRINVGLDMKYAPNNNPDFPDFNGTVNQSVDYSGDIPVQSILLADAPIFEGKSNDEIAQLVVDPNRASSQVANLRSITQKNNVDQFDFRGLWDLDESSSLTAGMNFRSQENITENKSYRQILGNWGAEITGDVEDNVPGGLETYCLSCRFEDHTIGGATVNRAQPNSTVYGVRGNAEDIFFALSERYAQAGGYNGNDSPGQREIAVTVDNFDKIKEDVFSLYVEFENEFEIAGRDAYINAGLRYENTSLSSDTQSKPTTAIQWQGNNDFATQASDASAPLSAEFSYSNMLPNFDFSVELTDNIKARGSYSTTIARTAYNNLFSSGQVNSQNGSTFLGGQSSADFGNPELLPLESSNVDMSVEWYFDDASYLSVGAFEKRVKNFVGRETVEENLFGIKDASSGAPGTRSATAIELLQNLDVAVNENHLFAMTAFVDNSATPKEASDKFEALLEVSEASGDLEIPEDEYTKIENEFNIDADDNDPVAQLSVNRRINNKVAKIQGLELQGQHFFGETGFGVLASYTIVSGDVGIDVTASPNANQFALTGLSDTANLTLIYENYGFNARLAYNWRDEFLDQANDGSPFRNPIFTEDYAQLDLSVGYDVTDNLSLSLDAINLTEESTRQFGRSESDLQFLRENGARFMFGANYQF